MLENIYIMLTGILLSVVVLRKALVAAATLQNNAGSFLNLTNDKLHIRRIQAKLRVRGTIVALDEATLSIDEEPVAGHATNDSRAHLLDVKVKIGDVGSFGNNQAQDIIFFERGELVLDSDDAIFMNTVDDGGAPTVLATMNIYYED